MSRCVAVEPESEGLAVAAMMQRTGGNPLALSAKSKLKRRYPFGSDLGALLDKAMSSIREPRGQACIAVICKKGGSGKTTTSVNLANMFNIAGVDAIVVDANSDGTSLGARVDRKASYYIGQIAPSAEQIQRWDHLRDNFCSFTADDTPVLIAHKKDWTELMDLNAFSWVLHKAAAYNKVVVVDCGTNLNHPVTQMVLQQATHLVTVGNAALDELDLVSETFVELEEAGYGTLVQDAVGVLTSVPRNTPLNINMIHEEWTDNSRPNNKRVGTCRTVVNIPYDGHLAVGGPIDVSQLSDETKVQYAVLAAQVSAAF